VEKYLREKTSNLRSYAKKQIKKKFLGKQQWCWWSCIHDVH
jgi:hypothetical protein